MSKRTRIVETLLTVLSAVVTVPALAQQTPAAPDNPFAPPACVPGVPFSDVTCTTGFDPWIEQFAADGITAGCGGGKYCPSTPVTRDQMAVFIEKAMHGTGTWTPGNLGNQNTGLGAGSLPFSATGSSNTAVGDSSLSMDGSGYSDTAVGASSLKANTTGTGNTAVGAQSLLDNTSGEDNTAVGLASLQTNTQGSGNTAVGLVSMEFNTTASRNTAVGQGALQTQSYDPGTGAWGSSNTAVGAYALNANQPDGGNGNVNGTQNTAVGDSSLISNTTGFYNTALGYQSLSGNTTASANTAVGQNALHASTLGFDNTAIGWKAGARGGDSITGYGGSPVVLVSTVTGAYNTFVGVTGSTAEVNNCTAVGMDAYCDATNEVRLGNVFVTSIGGKVGWSALSDARAKTDVADLGLGLEFVKALRPVSFRYKGGDGRTDMGFVAQDVETLLGDGYSVLGIGGDKDRTLSLRYTDLIAPLVKAVQEQQATIEAQQAELAARDARIARLESGLSDLRAQVEALAGAQRRAGGGTQP